MHIHIKKPPFLTLKEGSCTLPQLVLLALGVTLAVELFNQKVFTQGGTGLWDFLTGAPLAFAVDMLLVLVTLVPALFLRRQAFWCTLLSAVWLSLGAVNGFILVNRQTPFTVADLTVLNSGLDLSLIHI